MTATTNRTAHPPGTDRETLNPSFPEAAPNPTSPPTVWRLADLADVASPDAVDSPGAAWLHLIEDAATEIEDSDDVADLADSLVPIYVHHRWQVFTDLAAYQEDVSELVDTSDLTQAAGVALYMIAALTTEEDAR